MLDADARHGVGTPSYREAARRVQAEMVQHDAGSEGADLLEELARTQRLVERGTTVGV